MAAPVLVSALISTLTDHAEHQVALLLHEFLAVGAQVEA
jgi:hypothetical protein